MLTGRRKVPPLVCPKKYTQVSHLVMFCCRWELVQLSILSIVFWLTSVTEAFIWFFPCQWSNPERCGYIIDSLWPIDTIWQHRSGSQLAQVMACCLMAPNHYLNQCWLNISCIHPRAISQKMCKICWQKFSFKIWVLKIIMHLPGDSESNTRSTKNKHCNHNKTLPILCTSLNIYSTHIQENCLWMLLVWCFERLKVTHNILIFLWSGTFQLLALLNINWFCWCMPQFLLAFCVLWVVSGVLWWIIGNYSHCWAVFGQDFCPSCGIPTHESWNKMAAILQTTLSNTFSWKKMCLFWRKFHWSLFPRV